MLTAASTAAFAETTLNALFMAQAAHSEADVRAMADFLKDGTPDFRNGGGLDAPKHRVDSYISEMTKPNSKEFLRADVRKLFQNGDAAFALNWTYLYNLVNDPTRRKVAGHDGVVPAPGTTSKSTVSALDSSTGLGVITDGQRRVEAWGLVEFLTSQAKQNKYDKLSLPIWASSQESPTTAKGQEDLLAAAKANHWAMYSLPTTPRCRESSVALRQARQEVLLGAAPPEDALATAAETSGL